MEFITHLPFCYTKCLRSVSSSTNIDKYTWKERIIKRLKEGDELSEPEIREVLWSFDRVYEEEGEDRRWSKTMLTVVNIDGELYAIEWEKGLTENQENSFWEQPYPVELKEEEITITKTTVVKKD